jgi:hypothetical protein
MIKKSDRADLSKLSGFNRQFFDSKEEFTYIGSGSLGGKATGLAFIKDVLSSHLDSSSRTGIVVNIPRLTVITTELFDRFMKQNNLHDIAYSDKPDNIIAHEFQKASLPAELTGDLLALIAKVHSPLAVRSSSLLEDAMHEPFAGIYETKMIPNNQPDKDTRFQKLTEAIKFVYASTYFKNAKDYIKATKSRLEDEKMAVIIQEIVGQRFNNHFYPNISGVARSFNYYPMGRAKPEDGVVNLALGLGKTIVDGDISWTYSPALPKAKPPFGSIDLLLENTQKQFWAVNMGKPPAYDPIKETEYLLQLGLSDAEYEGTLEPITSTYDPLSDTIKPGTVIKGPRIINFAPILDLNTIRLNNLLKEILKICTDAIGSAVEIEFAITIDKTEQSLPRFGFLQVRPMVVSDEEITISDSEISSPNLLLASERVLGNGIIDTLKDVIFVKPGAFEAKHSTQVARELEMLNYELSKNKTPYLLIGFGRWGSSDPWLGIPVNWGQISGAKVIVESMYSNMNVDLSQGSHFFHNITSFKVFYFSMPASGKYKIDWQWLNEKPSVSEGVFTKHVKLTSPLTVKVDGRTGRGVIFK